MSLSPSQWLYADAPHSGGRARRGGPPFSWYSSGVMIRATFLFALLVLSTAVAHAVDKAQPHVTGVYSDLHYISQEGDWVGTELFLLYSGGPYFALIQCADGRLGTPVLLPATVDGPTVRFTIPAEASGCAAGDFEGTVSPKGLSGMVKGSNWPGFLPRRKSVWQ